MKRTPAARPVIIVLPPSNVAAAAAAPSAEVPVRRVPMAGDIEDIVEEPLVETHKDSDVGVRSRYEVISASRRTDIPAFYLDWFINAMKVGFVETKNPRSGAISRVGLSPSVVKCIAWWSKDYSKWRAAWNDPEVGKWLRAYNAHLFNFTINSTSVDLEGGVKSSLTERLDQLRWLATTFGPGSIMLRFDPIVHYRRKADPAKTVLNNIGDFETIIAAASQMGIKKVAVAFVLAYPKVVKRMAGHGLVIVELTSEEKKQIIMDDIGPIATEHGVELVACCQPDLGLTSSACISGPQINDLLVGYGKDQLKTGSRKDHGQRKACNCTVSIDVGGYGPEFACAHDCAYCYAH